MEDTAAVESHRRPSSVADLISDLSEQQTRLMETYKGFLDSMKLESNLHETKDKLADLKKAGSKLILLQKDHLIKMLLMLHPLFRVVMPQSQFEEDACVQLLQDKERLQSYDIVELSCVLRCYFAKLAIYVYHLASFVKDRETYEHTVSVDSYREAAKDVFPNMDLHDTVLQPEVFPDMKQMGGAGMVPTRKQWKSRNHGRFPSRLSYNHKTAYSNAGSAYPSAKATYGNNAVYKSEYIPYQPEFPTADHGYDFMPKEGNLAGKDLVDYNNCSINEVHAPLSNSCNGISNQFMQPNSYPVEHFDYESFRNPKAYKDSQHAVPQDSFPIDAMESGNAYSNFGSTLNYQGVDDEQYGVEAMPQPVSIGMPPVIEYQTQNNTGSRNYADAEYNGHMDAGGYGHLYDTATAVGSDMPQGEYITNDHPVNVAKPIHIDYPVEPLPQFVGPVVPLNGNSNEPMFYRGESPVNINKSSGGNVWRMNQDHGGRSPQSSIWRKVRDDKNPRRYYDLPQSERKQSHTLSELCCDDGLTRNRDGQLSSARFTPDAYHPSFYTQRHQVCGELHVKGSDENPTHMTYVFYDSPIRRSRRNDVNPDNGEDNMAHAHDPSSGMDTPDTNTDENNITGEGTDDPTENSNRRNNIMTDNDGIKKPPVLHNAKHSQQYEAAQQWHDAKTSNNNEMRTQHLKNAQDFIADKKPVGTMAAYVATTPNDSPVAGNTSVYPSMPHDGIPQYHAQSPRNTTYADMVVSSDTFEKSTQVIVNHPSNPRVDEQNVCLTVQLSQQDVLADQDVESSDIEGFGSEGDVYDYLDLPRKHDIHGDTRYSPALLHLAPSQHPIDNPGPQPLSAAMCDGLNSDILITNVDPHVVEEDNANEDLLEESKPTQIAGTVDVFNEKSNTVVDHNVEPHMIADFSSTDIASIISKVTEKAAEESAFEVPYSSSQICEGGVLSSSRIRIPLIDMSKLRINTRH
ncbi:hypothetical protein X943_000067 [Babesia divergens]|uniref:Uncharacterized protein n=1 Tax=Babesia divergens TaxID=32595 RepID=A0AAD9GHG7_BABDI|nr:hypothetical protein X943_000067 [Babesia divergens]